MAAQAMIRFGAPETDSGSVFYEGAAPGPKSIDCSGRAKYQRPITRERYELRARMWAHVREQHAIAHSQANVMNRCRVCGWVPDTRTIGATPVRTHDVRNTPGCFACDYPIHPVPMTAASAEDDIALCGPHWSWWVTRWLDSDDEPPCAAHLLTEVDEEVAAKAVSRLEAADKIESIVGAKRHETDHIGRAVSAEQRVYILHSQYCKDTTPDLRDCQYSRALDGGIDMGVWGEYQDIPVVLAVYGGQD